MSVFKAGSTIPVKFQLLDANGVPVPAGVLPQWVAPTVVATTTAPVDESLYNDQPTTGLAYRWDATAKQYIYNWQTSKGDIGKVFRIGARLDDGTTMYVNIGLR